MKKPSTTEIGNNFENRIADLYDRLGYTVEKNQRQTGNQIDIIISRNIDGIGVVKYAVECKHLNKNVGVTIVNNFVSVIKTVSAANGFSGGVVVTNNGFSNSAKEAAFAHPGITLMTESELEEKILLGVTPEKIIQEYEKSEIFEYYITQSGAGKVPGLHSSLTFSDIREPFIKWILSKQHGNAFVLGDYGTGKTTFLDRLRYELLKLFLKGESQQLPILFRLREFHKFSSLSEYLIQSFNENYRQVPDPAWLWSKVEEGSLVLLLDGFDEISIESNEKKRALQIANISPLLASASKSVISCRPSYFVSSEEFNEIVDRRFEDLVDDENGHIQGKNNVAEGVGDIYKQIRETVVGKISNADQYKRIKVNQYQVMNLVYLDKPKIMSYLQNFSNEFSSKLKASPKEVYEYLKKVYDITDLMRRPIILNMIVETLLTGRLDVKDTSMKVGPSAIYEIYTDAKLAMESEKGWMRRAFSPDERKEFAEVVAVSMFRNGALGIEFSEIGEIAQDYGDIAKIVRSSLVDRNIFEAIATDIVLCGFLTRVGDEFRFGHRSFMEFFVARHILGDILKTDRSEILTVEENIRHEILYYLASFIQFNEKAFDKSINILRGSYRRGSHTDERVLRDNLIRTLVLTGCLVSDIESSDEILLSDISLHQTKLDRLNSKVMVLRKVQADCIELANCELSLCEIIDSALKEITLSNQGVHIKCEGSVIDRWNLKNCRLNIESGKDTVSGINATKSDIVIGKNDLTKIIDSEIDGGRIILNGDKAVTFSNSKFYNSEFANDSSKYAHWQFRGCSFYDCVFKGIFVRGEDITTLLAELRKAAERGNDDNENGRFVNGHGAIMVRNIFPIRDLSKGDSALLDELEKDKVIAKDRRRLQRYIESQVVNVPNSNVIVLNILLFQKSIRYRDYIKDNYAENFNLIGEEYFV